MMPWRYILGSMLIAAFLTIGLVIGLRLTIFEALLVGVLSGMGMMSLTLYAWRSGHGR